MSIVDNQVERQEAELRLGAADEVALERDLAYWAVKELDANHEYAEVQHQLEAIVGLHREAHGWVTLITGELRKRRDEKRSRADG